ncbi:MAG: hypothetical protein O2960_13505 [Verrucomicrobia bacterium]|nr:hypothetical protein [Verrucomicrobiota bacterium]
MAKKLTVDDAKQSLTAHVAAKGAEIREKYGNSIGWTELLRILEDRAFVRYPCKIQFDDKSLRQGEFGFPVPNGDLPEDGFTMFVHPFFSTQLDRVPYLVLYQLVSVNYGEFASSDDAEAFGAAALGLSRDAFYQEVCALADALL